MKTITLLLVLIFGCVTAVLAETERPAPTIARIIGDLPDGTPPSPPPPPPPPPPLPMAEPPLDKADPAVRTRLAAFRAKYPRNEFIRIGATVYHAQDSTTRTLVTY